MHGPTDESDREPQRPFSPGAAEAALRRVRSASAAEVRGRLGSAAVELAGEEGYAALTVERILERTGTSRGSFYAHFSGRADCFAAGFDAAAGEIEGELLAPCEGATSWAQGMAGALWTLSDMVAARPSWARGALAEAQTAGGAAGARRKEGLERLSRAIDRARRENVSRHSSPPTTTPAFILAAIESAAVRNLTYRGGRDFGEAVPELLYLAVAPYLGTAAAGAAYREARRR